MMDAILMSMIWLIQTVVHYSIGAVLIALATLGLLAAGRRLLAQSTPSRLGGSDPVFRSGSA